MWYYPAVRDIYRYDDMQGIFKLEWSGSEGKKYILEYIAGTGSRRVHGFLENDGPVKDFGPISRRYWNTWVVKYTPVRLRVREEGSMQWSAWLDINVQQ